MVLYSFSKNIKQTVALPCYNASSIGWLALEGLCRQNPTPYDWELIVCEEPHEKMLGALFFLSYTNRLVAAGCNRLVYISPKQWVPLAQKWRMIGQASDKGSLSFLLQAADCYSPKDRLEMSQRLVQDGYEWVDYTKGYFYSLPDNRLILYNASALTNLNMAFPTRFARKLPFATKRKGVDGWLYKSINPKKTYRVSELAASLDTDGCNNISNRRRHYENPQHPFVATDKKINEIGLPKGVTDRLWM